MAVGVAAAERTARGGGRCRSQPFLSSQLKWARVARYRRLRIDVAIAEAAREFDVNAGNRSGPDNWQVSSQVWNPSMKLLSFGCCSLKLKLELELELEF